MVDVQDAYPCIPKARETSQKQGFTASDYGGHRRLFRGQGCWGPARAFRPSDGAQNRIQTRFFHAPRRRVHSLARDHGWRGRSHHVE